MMRVNRMTLDEFFQQDEQYVQGVRKELEDHFVQKAKAHLMNKPFKYSEKTALKVARGVVLNGEILRSNAEDSDEDDDDDETDLINDLGKECGKYNEIALLCIQAPTDKFGKPLEVDEKTRDMQFENFVKRHPRLKQENQKISKVVTKVYNYEAMMEEVERFIAKEGTLAYTAAVMFNGHGSENGLVFHEHREGEETPLDLFIEDFRQVVDKSRSAENLNLPRKVEVIFNQCFGHKHTNPNIKNFTIYAFTNDKVEKTETCDHIHPLSQDVTDSHHPALEEHAQNEAALWRTPLSKAAGKVDDGPSTSVNKIDDGTCTSVGLEEDMEVEAAF